MRDSVKSMITGIARGGLKGAMIGMAVMGAIVAAPALAGITSFGGLLAAAGTFVFGALGVVEGASLVGLGWAAVVGAGAMFGGIYKGVMEFVDAEEVDMQKSKIVKRAKESNLVAALTPSHGRQRSYAPKQAPDTVSKDEMPDAWTKKSKPPRGQSAPETTTTEQTTTHQATQTEHTANKQHQNTTTQTHTQSINAESTATQQGHHRTDHTATSSYEPQNTPSHGASPTPEQQIIGPKTKAVVESRNQGPAKVEGIPYI